MMLLPPWPGLGDVEVKYYGKWRSTKIVPTKEKKKGGPRPAGPSPQGQTVGSLKVTQCQIWMNLLAAGLATGKLGGLPLHVSLTLWKQLHPEQQ